MNLGRKSYVENHVEIIDRLFPRDWYRRITTAVVNQHIGQDLMLPHKRQEQQHRIGFRLTTPSPFES